jgi:hypothetical protein
MVIELTSANAMRESKAPAVPARPHLGQAWRIREFFGECGKKLLINFQPEIQTVAQRVDAGPRRTFRRFGGTAF